ncbi:DUF3299 domain-containing protein [Aliiruegeria lutimaris]|uniref:DUF3299 domain-containing protein n=1 Tax=Aliiruegeria lutimaris TaxID=571298 RepID=A0A1G9J859_9RHOB|nr:DUF3299 domain-containing protein [Aliiruegeria lutimaris]SDL33413.1 hypothetical protein SAMN04488026_10793 [Aliiruegeria lutimaris]
MNIVPRAISVSILAILVSASTSLGAALQIGWDDLAPPPTTYENPFADLTNEQLDDLRTVLRAQSFAEDELPDELQTSAEAARLRLEEQDLDIDWLFEQRQMIMEKRREEAVSTRPDMIGSEIRMPGYLLPLDLKDGRAVEFLLVPTMGACIHTPPPPANQMVHVRYPAGVEVAGLYTPIWISGTLSSNLSEQTVRYSDGEARIEVSYAMTADLVEPF